MQILPGVQAGRASEPSKNEARQDGQSAGMKWIVRGSGLFEAIEVESFEFFVAFFYGLGGVGEEGFEELEETGGVESVEGVGG